MSERIHSAGGSGMGRGKWTMIIAGTAVVLLVAGVAIQVTRPTSAFPEDGAANAPSAGRASMNDQSPGRAQGTKKVAKVGTQHISYDELAAECVSRYGKEILDNLINRKIIQQACDAQGIEVSDAEVETEINTIAQKFNMDRTAYLNMLQAERNVTPAQMQRDIIWPKLALKKLAGEEVAIKPEELKKAFVRNYGPRVKARAIVLDNSRRAAEVWELAHKNPDEFESLATKHSVDPSSRHLGGVIPPIPRYAGSPALEEASFKLKEGDISPVIQIGLNQFIILKCEGRTEPTVTKMDDQIEQILREQLHEEKVQESVANVFQKIKDAARVDNYLTGISTGGERKTAIGKSSEHSGNVRPAAATGNGRRSVKPIPEVDADAEVPASPPRASSRTGSRRPRGR